MTLPATGKCKACREPIAPGDEVTHWTCAVIEVVSVGPPARFAVACSQCDQPYGVDRPEPITRPTCRRCRRRTAADEQRRRGENSKPRETADEVRNPAQPRGSRLRHRTDEGRGG